MKKILGLCLGLGAFLTGYSQISGTGPMYSDDLLGLGFTNTTGIAGQLHVKTTGSLNFRLERYVSAGNNQNNTFDAYFTSSPVGFTGTVAPGSTIFQSSNANADMLFLHGTSSSKVGLFLKSNGYVGIGHATATERLDVNGNIRINDNGLYFRGTGDMNHGLGYNALGYTTVNGPVLFGYDGGLLGSNTAGTYNAALRWNNSGNVTIGSQSSFTNCKLTIATNSSVGTDNMINVNDNTGTTNFRVKANGYVYARDITVQVTAFPDYVFEPAYKLMPLYTLDQYVSANHHLPGVPAAAEVQQNGMSVSDMNVILVQKVEELTLYVIDLQKQIDAMKKQQ